MIDAKPSEGEWRSLYDAASRFKTLGCWNWMYDSDTFGVQDPESGEIGYCGVMGKLKEVFALVVYLGERGRETYLRIQQGKVRPDEALFVQDCLMASFEDRAYLDKEDLQVIKGLGLKFRGKASWPLFRRYEPGYREWFVSAAEARFLTAALEQTMDVALRLRENKELLTPPKDGQQLVRTPKTKDDGLEWADKWMKPKAVRNAHVIVPIPDELRLQRIKTAASGECGPWEADFFHMPAAVIEGKKKPHFPRLLLFADHESGMILAYHMTNNDEIGREFQDCLLEILEKAKRLPDEIRVMRAEAMEFLRPVASQLKIGLKLVEGLEALDQAKMGLMGMMLRG